MTLRVLDAAAVDSALDFPALIDALEAAFAGRIEVPVRHHHEIKRGGENFATHLLMPAWTSGQEPAFLGTKVVNVFPGNGAKGLPSIHGTYLLMSGETGAPLAAMDGARLTAWRTAAASALASRFLSRADSSHLLMIGAGALAPFFIRAHLAVRPVKTVTLWNRRREASENLTRELSGLKADIRIAEDRGAAIAEADIISCATLSKTPLIEGRWLKPGAHADCAGAYRPDMRETDDDVIRRARLFCDTRTGALKEGGDLAMPLANGVIKPEEVEADLLELCRKTVTFARAPGDITFFKSVGTAIEDLAAAMLVWSKTA